VFAVEPFTRKAFDEALRSPECLVSTVQDDAHAKYLFEYLDHEDVAAKTIVVERDYVDRDYLQDYTAFYATSFYPYNRFCSRVHFFNIELDKRSFAEIIRGNAKPETQKRFDNSYLGFIVVRPLSDAVIGRTQLRPYASPGKSGKVRFYSGVRRYDVNLFGTTVAVESMAFQEQDKAVAACATVALWSCFQKTARLFGTPTPRPPTITTDATSSFALRRAMPSTSLAAEQIVSAIKANGLDAEEFSREALTPGLIYGYLSAGIPVLLIVHVEGYDDDLHAVAINGYSFMNDRLGEEVRLGEEWIPRDTRVPRKKRGKPDFPTVGMRVKEFYAHDDQVGPFTHLYVNRPTKITTPFTMYGSWPKKGDPGAWATITPRQAIVPVGRKIRLSYLDVKVALRAPIAAAATAVLEHARIGRAGHEWDIHLTTTTRYKSSIRSEQNIAQDRRDYLLQASQPKYFWRCILRRSDGLDLMEVCFDATLSSKSTPVFLVNYFEPSFAQLFLKYLEPEAHGARVGYLRTMLLREYTVTTRKAADQLRGRRATDPARQ